ncbi:MAG TPA: ABC transporter permease subunit [Candidatus Limnocylindria bacterium]|nr:ABC transporter permease subunit [Candidatus Limnocylindria bacterium]
MKIIAIARNTAREALRNKVLYSIVAFAALVVCVAALFGSVSIGNQMKFVKDFSLAAISLFGVVIAVALGVSMLSAELRRRTILNILSKPVGRWQFILGKFAGLAATVSVVVVLMTAALVAIVAAFEGRFDSGLIVAGTTVVLELVIVVAIALFFSAVVVTPTLAGMFTIAAFVAGRSAGYLEYFRGDDSHPAIRGLATVLYWILPHLNRLDVADQVVYGQTLGAGTLALAAAYAAAYTAVLLLLSVALFQRREFV